MNQLSPWLILAWWDRTQLQMRRFMKDAILAVLARDAESLASALSRLGFIGEGADLTSLERFSFLAA